MSIEAVTRDMNIAVLQTGRSPDDLRSKHGDYDDMCKALLGLEPAEATTFAILDGEFPTAPENYDLLLITGSRHGVYEDHGWIAPLENLVLDAFNRGQKMVGICFGHQLIARALGGRVEKSEKGFGVGVMDYTLVRQDGSQADVSLCAWHQDQIITPPEHARIIAQSEFCPVAGLQYADKAISFQAHPEFSRDYVRDLIELRTPSMLDDAFSAASLATLESSTDTSLIQDELAAFLR